MRILIIGSGGREHAIACKVRQSPVVSELFVAPGNPGIAGVATCVPIKVNDVQGLADFAESKEISLTIVGPELPLTLGVVDEFQKRGLKIFGPSKEAARIEGSKGFSKELMKEASVPTATFEVFDDFGKLEKFLKQHGAPVVLKADGLAAGKGVYVCMSESEVPPAVVALRDDIKADRVVVESFLKGKEASLIVATDGKRVVPFVTSHDYKRIGEGDTGLNTGGMGTVSPTTHLTSEQEAWSLEHVIKPVLEAMARRGTPYAGFLYAGLMIDKDGEINCLEFNCRLGDPETQVILARMESDIVPLLLALVDGSELPPTKWRKEEAVCVVMASEGYPEKPRLGDEIHGIDYAASLPHVQVLHAGTALQNGSLVTNGGRVLNVVGLGVDTTEARGRAYRACDMIQIRGRQLRRDIGID